MGDLGGKCGEVLDQIHHAISSRIQKLEELESEPLPVFQSQVHDKARGLEIKIQNFLVAMDGNLDKNEQVFRGLCSKMDEAADSLRQWQEQARILLNEKDQFIEKISH